MPKMRSVTQPCSYIPSYLGRTLNLHLQIFITASNPSFTGTDLSYSGLDPPPSDKSESALSSNQLALNVDSSSVSALRPARILLIKDATSLPREREKQGKKHLVPPNSETAAQEPLNRRLLKGNSNSNSPFPKSQITLRPKHLYLMKTRDLFKPHHSRRTT